MSWSVGKRIAALCVVLIAMSVAVGSIGLTTVRTLLANLRGVATESVPELKELTTIQALGLEFRGTALLMGTPGLAAEYKNNQIAHLSDLRTQVKRDLDAYGQTVSGEEGQSYRDLQTATNAFLNAVDQFLSLSLDGKAEEAGAFWSAKGGPVSKAFRRALDNEVKFKQHVTDGYLQSGLAAAAWANAASWILLAMVAVLGVTLGWLVVRNITRALTAAARDLRQTAQEISGASEQLASGSQNLADNSMRQAAGLEETSAASREITEGTRQNARHCQAAAAIMTETEAVVTEANRKLDQSLAGMQEIAESSHRIAKIMRVIDEIAFRTNILALNAAVEAARAGEAGMGFAVVADEVRTLAGQCATAAKDVATSIEQSVESAENGRKRLDDAAESVREIMARALKVKDLVQQIDTNASQQTTSVDQIARALTQMEHPTQQTAAMAEESASASAELKAQTEAMEDVVARLEALI